MKDTLQNIGKTLSSPEYKATLAKIAELKKAMSEANAFRLNSVISESERFFSELKASSPGIFDIIKIQRKDLAQLAVKRKTGLSVIID